MLLINWRWIAVVHPFLKYQGIRGTRVCLMSFLTVNVGVIVRSGQRGCIQFYSKQTNSSVARAGNQKSRIKNKTYQVEKCAGNKFNITTRAMTPYYEAVMKKHKVDMGFSFASYSELANRVLVLKELGLPYTRKNLEHFSKIMNKSIQQLGLNQESIKRTIRYHVNNLSRKGIAVEIDLLRSDISKLSVGHMKVHILGKFLVAALGCQEHEIIPWINNNRTIRTASLQWFSENAVTFTQRFGWSPAKFRNYPSFLRLPPEHVEAIIRLPLAGVTGEYFVKRWPPVLRNNALDLKASDELFQNFPWYPSALLRQPYAFAIHPKRLKQELLEIEGIPEFRALKTHRRFPCLLYYYQRSKRRLKLSKDMGAEFSFNQLISSDSAMRTCQHFAHNKSDIVTVLMKRFPTKSAKEIRTQLDVHPRRAIVSVEHMHSILDFMDTYSEIKDETIFNALVVVLYPLESVKDTFASVIKSGSASLNDEFFLNMVLYELEKPFGFSGDGVWGPGSGCKHATMAMHQEECKDQEIDFSDDVEFDVAKEMAK